MKKLKLLFCFIIFALAFAGIFPLKNISTVNALYSGDVINNVIYLDFEDGDNAWIDEVPNYYTNDVRTIMENSYNNSTSSVNAYYKTMSFNNLNLTSNFYTNNGKAYKVPYTKNELMAYSKTNPEGFLKYEVCTYTSSTEPTWLSAGYLITTHQFSCYNCGNPYYSGGYYSCDMDTSDGIGCYCAYVEFANHNTKTALYPHAEEYIREQIALQNVLKQITNLTGNIDSNNDGYIDALTFIFQDAENVDWSDLLWPHQGEIIAFGDYFPYYLRTPENLLEVFKAHGVRNESKESVSVLLNEIEINDKICKSHNLYLFSHLLKSSSALKGADEKEIAIVFTLAHELGHVLGLPDYYTYDDYSESGEEDPTDVWELMGYAIDAGPTYLTTYSREILGFTNSNNIKTITESGTYTLKPTCYDEINNNNNNSNNVLAYVIEDPNYSGQKIYLEYRFKGGSFEPNYKYKDDGLIIYRIDNNVELDGFGEMLSQGNFGSYPFNMYVFRDNYDFAFNDSNNTFGNSNVNSTSKAITFQTYDTTKTQDILTKSDITFHNTGIVIENISINKTTNEISFKISGGHLLEPSIDFSSVKLNGEITINHNVNTVYTDSGIDYGDFSASDFSVEINSNVNTNLLGNYNYTYTLTHIESNKTLELIRIVKVVDTIKPTIILKGDSELTLNNIRDYVEFGVDYLDNYDLKENLILTTTIPSKYDPINNIWKVEYKVVDTSGNETIIYRLIYINGVDLSQVKLIGSLSITHEVNTLYQDKGINFENLAENQFDIVISTNLNVEQLGEYTYTYNLTLISTGETLTLTRNINVVDTIAPTIILNGESVIELYKSEFENFVDPGCSFDDNYDTLLTTNQTQQKISDTQILISYYAQDDSGNETTITRTIKIVPKPLNKTDNNISILIKNLESEFYTNNILTFELNYTLEDDNMLSESDLQIKFYVNNNEIISGITGKTARIKFSSPGIYNLKVVVENIQITKQIVIKDPFERTTDDDKTAIIALIIIISVIILGIICTIINKVNTRKIKKRLDRY